MVVRKLSNILLSSMACIPYCRRLFLYDVTAGLWASSYMMQPSMHNKTCCAGHLIEDMVVPLRMQLMRHSRLFQQVSLNQSTTDVLTLAEVDLDQLAKATAVVVAQGSGVAEGFQQRVSLQHLPLHACNTMHCVADYRLSLEAAGPDSLASIADQFQRRKTASRLGECIGPLLLLSVNRGRYSCRQCYVTGRWLCSHHTDAGQMQCPQLL